MVTDVVLSLSAIALVVLGTRVLSHGGKSRAARSFGLYCYAAACVSLIEVMVHLAPSDEVARAWGQLAAVWPLAWVFYARFAVESAGTTTHRRLVLGFAYAAAAAIAIAYFILARRGIVVAAATDFGYVLESPFVRTPLGIMVAVCYLAILGLTFVVLIRAALSLDGHSRRRQVLWVLLAYGLGFVAGVGRVLLREVGELPIREVNGFSYLVTAGVIYIGIVRRHLVHLSPELVAREALNQIDECFVLTDERYRIVSVNAAAVRTIGSGRGDLTGVDVRELIGLGTKTPIDGDAIIAREHGESTVLSMAETVTTNRANETIGRVIVGRDMTDSRRRESRLRELLSEKDVVVRELHHRVRNTLQLIEGIVSLKASRLVSNDGIDVFGEISDRIHLIARVYNGVYSNGELRAIALDDALRDLADQFRVPDTSCSAAAIELDVEPLSISAERAIPLLLAVAELIANACRHAYPADRPGTVRVRSARASETSWSIVVADSGRGIQGAAPPGAVGLMLAHELTRQVDGSLVAEGERGTTWTMTIPLPPA